ncbi:hypothetical protein GALL_543780 [mine drainage metagenome]|uniref:Uncharacterized protein n=1 Tax=mine drainage metagenome TaxID=410659 RepID=A0A1J5NZ67_9ZZZZ
MAGGTRRGSIWLLGMWANIFGSRAFTAASFVERSASNWARPASVFG